MQTDFSNLDDIFAAFGGAGALAEAAGVTPSHARVFRARKSIPVDYWPSIIASARDKGIAIDERVLVRVHTAPRQEPSEAAE